MGLKSDDAYTTGLQTVLRIAHALRDVVGVSHQPSVNNPPTTCPAVIDSINLPHPRPLLPSLLEAGFSHEIATSFSKAYHLRAEELRRDIQKTIVSAYCEIAAHPMVALALSPDVLIRRLVSTLTEIYLRRLAQWKEEVIQRIKQATKTSTNAAPRNSRNFNQEYVPLLEHFFEENPFPTHADKVFLAKKSNMQYRQIHVWFQNRRNRTKKEGKTLRKKPTYEGATKLSDKLYKQMGGHMIDTNSQGISTSSEGIAGTEPARDNTSKDAFVSSSPPHAFPSTYPPTCHYDPFPCKSAPVHFSKPEWRRVSCGKLQLSPPVSIDDLVEKFSNLNVRDQTRSKGSHKLQSQAATAAITVIPSRAPHPSLIVCKHLQPTNIVQLPQSVRAPVSCSRDFRTPSPTSKPVTLVPLSVPSNKTELPKKRKTAPLPQRFPGRMRNTSRDTLPSESSSTSSSPRLFSESRSCSFSSTNSLSTPSSIPELPCSLRSPCRSLFDSPIHLHNLGDTVARSPPSIS